ncbi:hypothetical protein GOP47_0029622 [Adiantum capillus-veneris]|nr:hypothetical protein GOP47_0029622 [Adiantum capillus-veneris]
MLQRGVRDVMSVESKFLCSNEGPGKVVLEDEGHAGGRCNDFVFFYNLLFETGDVPPISPQTDVCIFSEVDFKVLESLLNEDMPLFQVKSPSIDHDANAYASSVYKAFVCLFAGIYALSSLLEAQVATTYAHKENTCIMECSPGLVDFFTGFLAHGDKDETLGLTICAASEGLY